MNAVKTLLGAGVLGTSLIAGAPQQADAGQFYFGLGVGQPYYGGYGSYYGGHGHGYGHGGYGGSVWHDTSHYDYHPGSYVRHYDHYHYVPGHYHWHNDGHWDHYGHGHGHYGW